MPNGPAESIGTLPVQAAGDEAFGVALIGNGLITGEQLQAAREYAAEKGRGLRQAILELDLIAPDRLHSLAFEHLESIGGAGEIAGKSAAGPSPIAPDHERHRVDVRNELKAIAATASLADLIDQLLARACDLRATDVHLDPHEAGVRVRFRIDGLLQDMLELDPTVALPAVSRLKVMASLNIVDHRHSQDGRISFQRAELHRDLRMSTFPTALGEKVVVRIHSVLTDTHGFDRLGMTPAQVEQLTRLVARPYGAILVAGPVGSGKTTTLYTGLAQVNTAARNVMTIEDPIENRIAGVNQTQVNPEMPFHDGLRSMLRQDPDVIMIGEVRDDETARIGIRAALTGVLVFSSIHGADAPSTIGNLYNFGIPGYQLSNSLLAVVSQRLVRKICPYCRVGYRADARLLQSLDLDAAALDGAVFHRGVGCPACLQTGYLGRTGIFEIMEAGDELRELIFQQVPRDILRRVAIDLGMLTLKQSAIEKLLAGTTTAEELSRVLVLEPADPARYQGVLTPRTGGGFPP